MVYGEHVHYVVPAKIMLYISMELGLRRCRRSQKLSRAELLRFGRGDHRRHPATAPRQVAGLSSVVGRCVFGIVNRPLEYTFVQKGSRAEKQNSHRIPTATSNSVTIFESSLSCKRHVQYFLKHSMYIITPFPGLQLCYHKNSLLPANNILLFLLTNYLI